MSVFELLRRLFESRKLFSELLETFKKHPLLVISFITFVAPLTYVANYYLVNDNSAFDDSLARQEIIQESIGSLISCKDNAGLSIISVSINKEMTKDGTSYPSNFSYVYTYQDGVIVDKKQENNTHNTYEDIFYLPIQYTDTLKEQEKSGEPKYYNIKAVNTVPQIILKVLEKSEWYNQGLVEDLFLDAVIGQNQVIYIITFMNTSKEPNCDVIKIKSIFKELKIDLRKLKKNLL